MSDWFHGSFIFQQPRSLLKTPIPNPDLCICFTRQGRADSHFPERGEKCLALDKTQDPAVSKNWYKSHWLLAGWKVAARFTSQQLCVTKGCRFPKSLNFSFPQYRESTILYRHLQDPIPWYAFLVLLFGSTGCCLYIQFCTEEIFFSPINTGKMFLFWTVTSNRSETHTMFIPQLTAPRIQTVETSSRSHLLCQAHCPEFSRRKSLFPSL